MSFTLNEAETFEPVEDTPQPRKSGIRKRRRTGRPPSVPTETLSQDTSQPRKSGIRKRRRSFPVPSLAEAIAKTKPVENLGASVTERDDFVRPLSRSEVEADVYRIDTDILTVEGVARLLRCSVAHVRALPEWELPRASGLGRCHQYLRSDVIDLVRRYQTKDGLNSSDLSDLLTSQADNVRGCAS